MNFLSTFRNAVNYLKKFGVQNAEKEAAMIISHFSKKDIAELFRDNPTFNYDLISKIETALKRRSKREPLQYIIGYVDFYNLKIKVGRGVLIPRPETENLVYEAVQILKITSKSNINTKSSDCEIVDLCTGSGCIAIAIGKEFPHLQICAIDNSKKAINYAKKNARINNVHNITFIKGNLFAPIKKYKKNVKFFMIISNPPYIKNSDIENLMPEIKLWEPLTALNGGEDGLKYYRLIIPQSREFLKKGGYLIMEIGESQTKSIINLLKDHGYKDYEVKKDFYGKERIIISRYT